ncbi:MAG TPA: adenosylhomocysteinase [Candidatus Diapherotrites archaeon]|uniref:Adenosylhomocysteinase n=1 Tax=Candidatus Iainarchaeum sp. TaxID=3101447 RepID=A0A7J4J1R9_9ARCH|nr:adenosylhomocysteinase [Candidatus Diapherotrites archaeon]
MVYAVKDIKLAEQGMAQLEWAQAQMGALLEVKKRFAREKPLKGERIGMALHVTKETGILVRTLVAGGAKVAITGCNPLSTQDDVAAALAAEGVDVFAKKGETREEYYEYLNKVLDTNPTATIDDGLDLVTQIHTQRQDLLKELKVGTEETTTGVIRLRAMERDKELKYPVIAVNDNKTKHLFDNFYGTGQSTMDGILRATNILFAGKSVVVVGYGDCGRGVSEKARGLGGNVIVCEVDPVRALQAKMDGYLVMPLQKALPLGDVFVTVTGNKHAIPRGAFRHMKSGAILANSGHFDVEIDVAALEKMSVRKKRMRWQLDEYTLRNGKKLYLCAEGRLVNLGAAEGHPSTVMSLSFCGQALALEYGLKHRLEAGLHVLPDSVDRHIARLQLHAMGIQIDRLTKEQEKYLNSWKEGT